MGRTDRSAYRQNADRTGLFQDASVLYADGGPFPSDVDDIARCLFAQEIPLGVLTAIIGAPFFHCISCLRGKKSFI